MVNKPIINKLNTNQLNDTTLPPDYDEWEDIVVSWVGNVKKIKQLASLKALLPVDVVNKHNNNHHTDTEDVDKFSNATITTNNLNNNYKSADSYNEIVVSSRRQNNKIKNNNIKIQNTLDLHNLIISEAKIETLRFLHNCCLNNIKNVLIITGKGLNSADKFNTIKSNFLEWLFLSEFKQYIHTYSQAGLKHGGEGAFYLWLRRKDK